MESGRDEICLVLGASDTGKTTRVRERVNAWIGAGPVGVIDCDPGQSVIGPPGCVGWAVPDGPVENFAAVAADGISFVGHVTPTGHLLQMLGSLVRAVEALRGRCERVVIDTPGYVTGGAAASLWWNVVRAVRPGEIVALQRHNELAEVLKGLEHFDLSIERVHVTPEMPAKSEAFRREYRRRQMERYFAEADDLEIRLARVSVRAYHTQQPGAWGGHIVALADAAGNDRALGIVRNLHEGKLTVQTPLADAAIVAGMTVGDFVLG